ncbi:CPBP family intramembrane metalloprotease [Paenibacillus sp. N3/727]|uniref:CPBP family intramembrane glutamic endopeptidase n=1 Tax=Paenibacillus sp. N3/727 TaxID=2925845 RepID=UPI001F53C087|nr:type II CAAX endopeptidase family protein [Paenibacillus sp. N3/727]UNK18024.1 CPBP family intramembrane metalloprotease [Paenibacillus sp. N3/727]
MNSSVTKWKEQDNWTWKEFVALLLLEFVFVIGFIKFVVKPAYTQWLGNELYSGTLTGLTIAVVLTAGLYWVALRPKRLSWSELGVRSFPAKDWGRILLWTLLLIVGSVLVMVLTSFIGNTYENSKTEAMQQNVTFFTVLIAFVSAAIISPLYEEIFYRGFLYRWLRTRLGMRWAILLSSLIFTVIHIPTYNAMPVNFLGGVVFAWAYERSNSIWPAVIIHGLVNGIAVMLTALG